MHLIILHFSFLIIVTYTLLCVAVVESLIFIFAALGCCTNSFWNLFTTCNLAFHFKYLFIIVTGRLIVRSATDGFWREYRCINNKMHTWAKILEQYLIYMWLHIYCYTPEPSSFGLLCFSWLTCLELYYNSILWIDSVDVKLWFRFVVLVELTGWMFCCSLFEVDDVSYQHVTCLHSCCSCMSLRSLPRMDF